METLQHRLALASVAVFLVFSPACNKNGPEDGDSDVDDTDEGGWFRDVGLNCDGGAWVFTAQTSGAVETVEVETWVGNDSYPTQDLIDRGAGDWFLEVPSATMGTDCVYGAHLVFTGYTSGGSTFEDSL